MKKLALKIILLSVLVLVLTKIVFDPIFNKNSSFRSSIEQLYELNEDSLDVLILGSSHARNTYNTYIIDKALSINSYSLSSDGQKIVVSHNLLEDVFKQIKPKLIILDIFSGSLDFPETDQQKSYQLRVFDNSKWTFNKLKVVTSIYSFEELPSVLSPTIRNHKNWNIANWTFGEQVLDSSQALYNRGFAVYYTTIKDKERAELLDYKYRKAKYLKFSYNDINLSKLKNKLSELEKTIETCKKNNVELLLVSSPYFDAFYSREASDLHVLVKQMCEDHGIRFLDFNTKFDELDLTMDDFRDRSHVNLSGADKVTGLLVGYLIDNQYFKIDRREAENLSSTLKSLSNTFQLNYEEKLNKEIFPDVFVTQIAIYQNNQQQKIELFLDKKEGVRDLISQYNLEFVGFPYEEDMSLLKAEFKDYQRERQTFYTLKDVSVNGQNKITVIFPKSNITKYKRVRLFSFVKNNISGHRYIIDFPHLDLSKVIESKFTNEEATKSNNLFSKAEKLLTKPFEFNQIIKIDEIGYKSEQDNRYTFIFKIGKDSNYKEFQNFTGYIRYYNGEIKEQNKHVKAFPSKFVEIDGYNYIFATINISNVNISKLDIFFVKEEPKEISNSYTLKDLKLKGNIKNNK